MGLNNTQNYLFQHLIWDKIVIFFLFFFAQTAASCCCRAPLTQPRVPPPGLGASSTDVIVTLSFWGLLFVTWAPSQAGCALLHYYIITLRLGFFSILILILNWWVLGLHHPLQAFNPSIFPKILGVFISFHSPSFLWKSISIIRIIQDIILLLIWIISASIVPRLVQPTEPKILNYCSHDLAGMSDQTARDVHFSKKKKKIKPKTDLMQGLLMKSELPNFN